MLSWIVRAAISLIVAAVLLSFVPLGSIAEALTHISAGVWIGVLLVFLVGHYLNAVKLRLLLGPDAGVSQATCVRAHYAGLVATLGLPGLAGGDVVRAAYLARTVGVKRVAVISVVDRLIDMTTLVVLIAVAIPIAGVPDRVEALIAQGEKWLALVGVAGAIAIGGGVVWWRHHPIVRDTVARARDAVRSRRMALVVAVAISLVVQSMFVLTNVWVAERVGVAIGLSAWFVAWPLSKIVSVLPISLGGLGVREALLVSLLAPYGAPKEAVLASGIVWQSIVVVSGLVGFVVTHGNRRREAAAAAADVPERKA